MSDDKTINLATLIYRTVVSYHLRHRGEATVHNDNVLDTPGRDAIEAGMLALVALQQMTPTGGIVFNLQLSVSLVIPDRSEP